MPFTMLTLLTHVLFGRHRCLENINKMAADFKCDAGDRQ